jgi:hypothetical protein
MKPTPGQITVIDEYRMRPKTSRATPSGRPILPGHNVLPFWENPASNPPRRQLTPNWSRTYRKTLSATTLAIVTVFGLLLCSSGPYAQAATPDAPPHFENASIEVPAGNSCVLHPKDNPGTTQSITIRSNGDGVLRFLAVRPNRPHSVEQLTADCTDSQGNANTYPVDLRSEETFVSRPFDPVRANLKQRPALTGDPLGFTQNELIGAGYGVRPDPIADPRSYKVWLAAVSAPAYLLGSAPRALPAQQGSRPEASVMFPASTIDSVDGGVDGGVNAAVSLAPSPYWTGAQLTGSYQKNAKSSETYGYVMNVASVTVPTLTPGGYGTGATAMTIWNGLDNVFQSIVDASTTPTFGGFDIHRQNFYNGLPIGVSIDEQGSNFIPNSGDTVLLEEWYCDAAGNVKMGGGYGCTMMFDANQGLQWECDQATLGNNSCQSYPIASQYLANGVLGKTAEYVIENDTAEVQPNCPSKTTSCYNEWVDFSPVTMTGSAMVVKGASATGYFVSTSTDPAVSLLTDNTSSVPFVFGGGHLLITLPTGGVTWSEIGTNTFYWNGSSFDTHITPQGTSNAQPGVIVGCSSSIVVGPSSRGLTNGTPWATGCTASPDGNYDVYQMETGGAWVRMADDVAVEVAVSVDGDVWAINAAGNILYWNGSDFVANPTGGCATSIAVGPSSRGLTHGTPWIAGCSYVDGNHSIYQMQTNGVFVKMQADVAETVAVSPEGNAWALTAGGEILYWNGSEFVENAAGGCATSIGVGPNSRGLTMGTPWITGCKIFADNDHSVYQMQTGGAWVKMQDDAAYAIAVSPEGYAWVTTF